MPKAEFFKRHTYTPNEYYDFLGVMNKAMAGDMVWVITPPVIFGTPPTAVDWSREVTIELQTAAGEVHEWYDETLAAGVGIADDATGDAALADGTVLDIVEGRGTVTVEGTGAFLGGTRQVGTTTVTAAASASGTMIVTITAAASAASPIAVSVPVAIGDTAAEVAERIRVAMNEDEDISAVMTVTGTAANIVKTLDMPAAQDVTLDLTITDADGSDVTAGATTVDTVAGVAPETVTLTVEARGDLLGDGPAQVTQLETFITPV